MKHLLSVPEPITYEVRHVWARSICNRSKPRWQAYEQFGMKDNSTYARFLQSFHPEDCEIFYGKGVVNA